MQVKRLDVIITIAAVLLPLALYGGYKLFRDNMVEDPQKLDTPKESDDDNDDDDSNEEAKGQLETDDIRGLGYSGQNKIVTDSEGNIYTAYRKKYDGNYEIYVSKFNPNLKLVENDKPIQKIGDGAVQRVPSIAIDDKDNLYVVWYGLDPDNDDLGRQIKFSKSTDKGESWSDYKNIAIVDGYTGDEYWQEHPQITFKSPNNLFVVWEGKDEDHEEQQVKFTKSTDGGRTWSNWKNLFEFKENTQSRPNITLDSQGKLHIFFYSSKDADQQQVWHSISEDDGETWSDPQNISKSDLDSRHMESAAMGNRIMAVWRAGPKEDDEGNSHIYYASFIDNQWSEPKKVSESSDYQFFPSIGINKNNQAAVVWMETSEKSDYPRENPEGSESHISFFDNQSGTFTPKKLILKESVYPHVIKDNKISDQFYVVVGEGREEPIAIQVLPFQRP